ncbi:MAG: Mur ligase family protein, partial [Gammaproteobacteria bacterium]|nr:Mur ligase family protein [Gammaproteobacteria bacterium]
MAARHDDNARSVALSRLLNGLATVPAELDRQISDVTLDSRAVKPGSLFMAVPGTRTHGLQFARDAWRQGAVAIAHTGELDARTIHELNGAGIALLAVNDLPASAGVIAGRFYEAPSDKLRLIGVTGTDGKTSVSHLLAQVLDSDPARCGLLGTLGSGRIGDLQPFGLTTPDAVTLQALLADFASAGLGHAVMEVSSHALAQHRISGCHFALAVLTNLGRDHLDYHGDLDAYARAKASLFQVPDLEAAVLNLDDPFSATLQAALPRAARVFG